MKLKLALLAAAIIALPFASVATAFHGQTCSAAGAVPATDLDGSGTAYAISGTVTPANGFVYQSPPGTPLKFTLTLTAGDHYAVIQQTADVDFVFCLPGALLNRHLCANGNVMPATESCLLGIPGNPGSGPPITMAVTGTVVIYAMYCSGTFCGYPIDFPEAHFAGVIV